MASLKYQAIASFARERAANPANSKKLLSIALGIALSRKIHLPSSESVNGYEHYANIVTPAVLTEASAFNENVVVDIDLVEQTARAMWLLRYFNAYPLKVIPLLSDDEGHFMNKLSGVGHLINPQTFEMCQAESSLVISLVNKIRELEEE